MTQSLEKLSVMLFINGFILFQKLLQIRLRRRNRRDAEVLHQIIQHIRRQESREGGAEPDIFNPQMLFLGEHAGKCVSGRMRFRPGQVGGGVLLVLAVLKLLC